MKIVISSMLDVYEYNPDMRMFRGDVIVDVPVELFNTYHEIRRRRFALQPILEDLYLKGQHEAKQREEQGTATATVGSKETT